MLNNRWPMYIPVRGRRRPFHFIDSKVAQDCNFCVTDWFSGCTRNITWQLKCRTFSLPLLQPFNFSYVKFACKFQDWVWGSVILREIDFLLEIFRYISSLLHCGEYVLEYRYVQVWMIVKTWKQITVGWFLESIQKIPNAFVLPTFCYLFVFIKVYTLLIFDLLSYLKACCL